MNGHRLTQMLTDFLISHRPTWIYPVKSSGGGLPNAAFNWVNPVKSSEGGLPKVAFNKAGTDSFSSSALKSGLNK
jgi:hypothetical protein